MNEQNKICKVIIAGDGGVGKTSIVYKMVQLAHDLKKELQKNRTDSFGKILHENWLLKKNMASGVSNNIIDEWYEKGCAAS